MGDDLHHPDRPHRRAAGNADSTGTDTGRRTDRTTASFKLQADNPKRVGRTRQPTRTTKHDTSEVPTYRCMLPPKPSARVQRSDAANKRKLEALMEPSPPAPQPARAKTAPKIVAERELKAEEIAHINRALQLRPASIAVTAIQYPPPANEKPPSETSRPETTTPKEQQKPSPPSTAVTPPPTIAAATKPKGPTPPPLRIEVATGVYVSVPYHAATISRRFRARTKRGTWMLRFGERGELRYSRRIP